MKSKLLLAACLVWATVVQGQLSPAITSWILNTTGATGFNGIPSNVQQVQYSTNNVYVSCTCIPSYSIGPWTANPNTAVNQNFVYKITLWPQAVTGAPVATPLGHVGVWTNGVSVFNALDAMSYNNQGVWNQNAVVVEGISFDNCLGHPAPNGEYHHHLNPTCLYDDTDSSAHAPIIGYAFDGFPIYGAYGYVNPAGTGGITRMKSGYRKRNITARTTLPDGTVLNPPQYGPAVNGTHPLGYYIEDYEYVAGLGDLDEHNGRYGVTPEYPSGTYAYFVTLDSALDAEYPYTVGPTYYGSVPPGNTGPNSGHNTISEPVVIYTSIAENDGTLSFSVFPNPAVSSLSLYADPGTLANMTMALVAPDGRTVVRLEPVQPATQYTVDVSRLPGGVYVMTLYAGSHTTRRTVVIAR